MFLNDLKCNIFPKGVFPLCLLLVNPFITTTHLPSLVKPLHLQDFLTPSTVHFLCHPTSLQACSPLMIHFMLSGFYRHSKLKTLI